MSDVQVVEVIAEGSVGDVWPELSARNRQHRLEAARRALAALRADGWEVYRPDECGLMRVYRDPDGHTNSHLAGMPARSMPVSTLPGDYLLVPVPTTTNSVSDITGLVVTDPEGE